MCSRRLTIVAALCAGLALPLVLAGCGSSGPKVYPVQGKVVFKGKGGNMRHLIGGKVRFRSTSDAGLTAVGSIEDDGVFSMAAIQNEKGLTGVPAGAYKARVELPRSEDDDAPRVPIHPKYLDFDKSGLEVTVPTQGDVILEVEKR